VSSTIVRTVAAHYAADVSIILVLCGAMRVWCVFGSVGPSAASQCCYQLARLCGTLSWWNTYRRTCISRLIEPAEPGQGLLLCHCHALLEPLRLLVIYQHLEPMASCYLPKHYSVALARCSRPTGLWQALFCARLDVELLPTCLPAHHIPKPRRHRKCSSTQAVSG